MKDFNGKIFEGFELNPMETDQYAVGIGKFIVNFGAIELLTYQIIDELQQGRAKINFDQTLGQRLNLIKNLTTAHRKSHNLESQLAGEIIKTINRIRELAKLRNDIAHNPVIIGNRFSGGEKIAYFGVPKVRNSYGKPPKIVNIDTINLGVAQVAEQAQIFYGILVRLNERNNA